MLLEPAPRAGHYRVYKPVKDGKNALGSYFGERGREIWVSLDGESAEWEQDTHIVFGELSHCKDAKEGCLVGGCNGPQSAKRKSLWHERGGSALCRMHRLLR